MHERPLCLMRNALGIARVMNKEIKPMALTSGSAEHVEKSLCCVTQVQTK